MQQAAKNRRESRRILSMAIQEDKEKENLNSVCCDKGSHKPRNFSYGDASAFLLPNLSTSATDLETNTAKNSTPEASVKVPITKTIIKTTEKASIGKVQVTCSKTKKSIGTQTTDVASGSPKRLTITEKPDQIVRMQTKSISPAKKPVGPNRKEPIQEFFVMVYYSTSYMI